MSGSICAAALFWGCVAQPGFDFFSAGEGDRPFAVMVHRGRADLAPENTAPAIEACIERGYEWVEIDVRLTLDKHHVVFHDGSVDGKTDGHGAVAELTLEEVKRLDAGSNFSTKFAGEKILTFAECLRLCKDRINIYIDCKDVSPPLLVEEIRAAGMERQVVVFDAVRVLAVVQRLSGGTVPIMPKWHTFFGIEAWVERVQPAAVEINVEEVNAEVCRRFRELGVVVQAKVLGDDDLPDVWRSMLESGVEWFQTDRPDAVIEVCTAASAGAATH